jgi:hypothetical protein
MIAFRSSSKRTSSRMVVRGRQSMRAQSESWCIGSLLLVVGDRLSISRPSHGCQPRTASSCPVPVPTGGKGKAGNSAGKAALQAPMGFGLAGAAARRILFGITGTGNLRNSQVCPQLCKRIARPCPAWSASPSGTHRYVSRAESYRWIEMTRCVARVFPASTKVGDREGDIFDLFLLAAEAGHDLLARSAWDRGGERQKLGHSGFW